MKIDVKDDLVYINGEFEEEPNLYFQVNVLGFCGCGDSISNIEYIKNGLEHINKGFQQAVDEKFDSESLKKEALDIFGSEAAKYFFYYWADKEGYTEHGSVVPGWLTCEGKELVESIGTILKLIDSEE